MDHKPDQFLVVAATLRKPCADFIDRKRRRDNVLSAIARDHRVDCAIGFKVNDFGFQHIILPAEGRRQRRRMSRKDC
ncbi:hypothetical protein X730_23570 [Mesorhizobium sp. L103C565B0]|nr:hypothetical protein X730_23570 [Mesorhizobium sp. L103C565B0]